MERSSRVESSRFCDDTGVDCNNKKTQNNVSVLEKQLVPFIVTVVGGFAQQLLPSLASSVKM